MLVKFCFIKISVILLEGKWEWKCSHRIIESNLGPWYSETFLLIWIIKINDTQYRRKNSPFDVTLSYEPCAWFSSPTIKPWVQSWINHKDRNVYWENWTKTVTEIKCQALIYVLACAGSQCVQGPSVCRVPVCLGSQWNGGPCVCGVLVKWGS